MKTVRLSQLQLSCRKAHRRTAHWNWADDLSHLSNPRLLAWQKNVERIMEVIDSAESLLMAMQTEGMRARARVFLRAVELGLDRHQTLLHRYRRNTFPFHSDRAFRYEGGSWLGRSLSIRNDSLPGLALMRASSQILADTFRILARRAQADGAQNLLTLLSHFSRDHQIHAQGLSLLIREEIRNRPALGWSERLWIRGVLSGLRLYARSKGLGDPAKFMTVIDRGIQAALIDCAVLDS